MFGKKKKKEFKFSEALIEQAKAVEASAKKSSAKSSNIEADVQASNTSQRKVELAEKQAQLTELERKLAKTAAKVAKVKRPSARTKSAKQFKNSEHSFPGKFNNAKAKSPADKLADAAARYKLNDYGNNVSQRAKDRDLAKQHNINNAKRVHDNATDTTWLTIASACEAFGMLETTLRRLCSDGTLLSRNTGKTLLISSATINDFLNKL
jgi:hypothetical protein